MTKEIELREVLLESYKNNNDAVNAGLYFISLYQEWEDLSAKLTDTDRTTLDRAVCQILNGESSNISNDLKKLGESVINQGLALPFNSFMMGLLSGEALKNPFIIENRMKIGAAVMNDALNETARRVLKGKQQEAAEICKWNILSSIAAITNGADEALRINIMLKSVNEGGIK